MSLTDRERLREIRSFPSLVRYLRDELDWPITTDDFEELTFDYTPEELGIDPNNAAKIQEIKRLRPLSKNQPWGIFFVKFEPKRLPVVALRRILSQVVLKKRASANKSDRASWNAEDLLFISNYGEGNERQLSFAHFSQDPDKRELATLKVLGWDNLDTPLHIDAVAKELAEGLVWPSDEADIDNWRNRWSLTFKLRHGEVIATSKLLSIRLAELARAIRDRIKTALEIETENGPLKKLLKAFREALVHDLDEDGFADMYAQTIAYGLLSARIADPHHKTADDLAGHMRTNPFLQELMETFLEVGGRPGKGESSIDFDELGVGEVVELLNNAKLEAIVMDFGDLRPEEDPVIHFYELFLKEYSPGERLRRGVFYTPRPVVSFIVRSVDELLRIEFGLEDGLADTTTWGEMENRRGDLEIPEGVSRDESFVRILDPACGTGTFLVEVIDLIHRRMTGKWQSQGFEGEQIKDMWNKYVQDYLLSRLFGYELLMAPYAIAHLKIGLKLHETGYPFTSKERVRIYLTNSLEAAHEFAGQFEFTIPALAHESMAVNEVKRRDGFTVVIGNPPYSVSSANSGKWITDLCEPYKANIRKTERQIQALSDDYVKFLRLAHWHVERSGVGVVGFITNNGFLDGHLFVDMRSSLGFTFPRLSILNLHGNLRTGERTPEGKPDENVFDIQTGVAISCLARPGPALETHDPPSIDFAEIWGDRDFKYTQLSQLSIEGEGWTSLALASATSVWRPMSSTQHDEWERMYPLLDVFGSGDRKRDAQKRYAAGFVSQQDDFAITFSPQDIHDNVGLLLQPRMTESELRKRFRLCTTSQWSFHRAREELRPQKLDMLVTECAFRPFDTRWTLFHRGVVSILRKEVMRHLWKRKNLALLATRGISRQEFAHVFVVNKIVDRHALDNASESMFVFPLYIHPEAAIDQSAKLLEGDTKLVNFSPHFVSDMSASTGLDLAGAQEELFQYIYAVLHSPEYRSRFSDFVRVDFPRIPLPNTPTLFLALAGLGGELVALHLLESRKLERPISTFMGRKDLEVGRVGWSDETVWLDAAAINKAGPVKTGTVGFRGVPEEVWNFHIGGYQVCEKWLKDRKGRKLTKADIDHYQKIVVAISETIQLMDQIDEVIESHGGWPNAFLAEESQMSTPAASGEFALKIVKPDLADRYVTAVPLVPLKIAAGGFGDPQHIDDEDAEWVAVDTKHKLRPGMFASQVVGKSMEPGIPDGSYCLFRGPVEGTRQGKTVLVQLRDAIDPETGQRYTVKRYESEKKRVGDSWRHTRILLKPTNSDFDPIEVTREDEINVVAEFVDVLDLESTKKNDDPLKETFNA